MTLLPPDVLAGLSPKQRAQVKRAEAALVAAAAARPKPKIVGADITGGDPLDHSDPVQWLRALWPNAFTGELAPYHVEMLEWLFARDVNKSSAA